MKAEVYNSEIYHKRIEKLENAKMRLDEIRAKVNGLEKELLEIKMLDKIITLKKDVDRSRKKPIYKVDDILFYGNLMYQRFPTDKLYSWREAIISAKRLNISGYDGWRLPTVEELERLLTKRSFVNSRGDSYYIIRDFLEVLPDDGCFWTSTEENELYAWVVDFSKGYDYWRRKTLKYHALFVRDIADN
ncbi:MAG: DUF1566 domain-containing protein [Epsilonproteobacteria bacterium]|nr:DUF1566 domain-containing protein [Campylobacterota bacterium]